MIELQSYRIYVETYSILIDYLLAGNHVSENISLDEFKTWVEGQGFLTKLYRVMVLNEYDDDRTKTITFEEYLDHDLEFKHVEDFIRDRCQKK